MAPRLRLAVFALAIASAFAGGYLLKNPPSLSTAVAQPAPRVEVAGPVAERPAAARAALVTQTPPLGPAPASTDPVKAPEPRVPTIVIPSVPSPKAEPTTILMPPVAVSEPPKPEPVDPSDPAFQMIKNQLGIKTTVLDKSVPPPVILADAKRAADVDVPPQPAPPPEPMTGPVPRLEAPRIEIGVGPGPAPSTVAKPVPLLNNRAVELDFEVTKAGLSKVTAVELWTTRDGGVTWKRTDRMEGSNSPFRTRLGSEGEYGFRMVFESEVGMRTPEPKPGQVVPDLVMELDTTPPEIRIFPPTAGSPGTIILRWLVADKHADLDPAATRLEYSADGQTWLPIARPATAVNADRYEWALPPGVPSKVLFRVTARDKAGNVATAVTNEKMSVDLVAPEGKVTGVRVQGAGPEKGPMPHEVQAGVSAGEFASPVLRAILGALLNSPEFGFRPSPPESVRELPSPLKSVAEFQGRLSDQYEEMLRTLVPAESAKDWVARVMKTDVVEANPAWTYQRRDPLTVGPAREVLPEETERLLSQVSAVRVYDPKDPDAKPERRMFFSGQLGCWDYREEHSNCKRPDRTLLQRERRHLAEHTFHTLTRGETVILLLTDTDWTPSTAAAESYRLNVRAVDDRPFGGTFDIAPAFWETPPVGGVRLDF